MDSTSLTGKKYMNKEELLEYVLKLCPEVEQLGLYAIVIGKGRRY